VASEPLPAGHHYWHELVGLSVRDETGQDLGRVVDVYRAGGAEVVSVVGGPLGPLEVPMVGGIVRRLEPGGAGIVVEAAALGLEEPGTEGDGPATAEAARQGRGAAGRRRPPRRRMAPRTGPSGPVAGGDEAAARSGR
jgi:hypothetical protein